MNKYQKYILQLVLILGQLILIKTDKPAEWIYEENTNQGWKIQHGPDTDNPTVIWMRLQIQNTGWFSLQIRQGEKEQKVNDLYLLYLTFTKDAQDGVQIYEYDNDFVSYMEKMIIVDDDSYIEFREGSYSNGQYDFTFTKSLPPSEAYISFCGDLYYQFNYEQNHFELPPLKEDRLSTDIKHGKVFLDNTKYKCINKILDKPPKRYINGSSQIVSISLVLLLCIYSILFI